MQTPQNTPKSIRRFVRWSPDATKQRTRHTLEGWRTFDGQAPDVGCEGSHTGGRAPHPHAPPAGNPAASTATLHGYTLAPHVEAVLACSLANTHRGAPTIAAAIATAAMDCGSVAPLWRLA